MPAPPDWLPEPVSLDGDPDEIIERLYLGYYKDFKSSRPQFGELSVFCDQKHDTEDSREYEVSFWELIQGHGDGGSFHEGRAKKLRWCAAVIQNSDDSAVTVFDREEKGRIRTYLWLRDHDYVVVLEKREFRFGPIMWLVTAYTVDGNSTRAKLQRKFESRLQ